MEQHSAINKPRCSVFIAASVDGYIADSEGSTDFLTVVEAPGEDYGYADFESTVDGLVVGRRTYEAALRLPSWPYRTRVIVLADETVLVPRHGEEFYSGDVSELTAQLGREGLRHLYVDGGATVRSFLDAGLVDELTISIVPVVLGSGVPLFGAGVRRRQLDLIRSRSFESGLVQLTYVPR